MKIKWIDLLSGIIIIISLFFIIRYFAVSAKKESTKSKTEQEYMLTEAECKMNTVDVGHVKQNTTISQDFVFVNQGEHPLVLRAINPDCHCTDFKVSQYAASLNDSIVVTLFVDTDGKSKGETILNTVVQLNTLKEYYLLKLACEIVE